MKLRHPLAASGAALCAAAASLGAQAQNAPYYIGISQGFTHESNVLHTERGAVSDTLSVTSLLAGVDQRIGRQRVFGNLNYSINRFQESDRLNNNSYGVLLGVDWETIERISGTVSLRADQALSRYDYITVNNAAGVPQLVTDRNTARSLQFSSITRIGVVTRLTAELGFNHQRIDHSSALYDFRDYHHNAFSAGLRYQFSGSLNAGIAARFTKGTYPHLRTNVPGVYASDDVDRRDIDLTANWTPGGASALYGRLSLSQTDHSLGGGNNFSGVTGALTWDWRPTGKLRFVSTLSHDTGEEAGYLGGGGYDMALSNGRTTTAIGTQATYELSSKVVIDGSARLVHRSLSADVAVPGGVNSLSGSDNFSRFSLGVRWSPTRVFTLGCSASLESRTTGNRALSYPYDATSLGCYGQAMLRF